MTLDDLARTAAAEHGCTKKLARAIIEGTFTALSAEIVAYRTVKVRHFGTFRTKKMAAKTAMDPRTRQRWDVPEHRKIVFKPALTLKHAIK